MIFYKICPLCQDLCDIATFDNSDVYGHCSSRHDYGFMYSFSTNGNQIIIELSISHKYYATLTLFGNVKRASIVLTNPDNSEKEISIDLNDSNLFNWSDFNLDILVSRIDKIFQMQAFA